MIEVDPAIRFRCISGCNTCCVVRGYLSIYSRLDPETGTRFPIDPRAMGKEGIVEVEAWKLPRMVKLGRKMGRRTDDKGRPIEYNFLPAKAVSAKGAKAPETVISYWLMGRDEYGDTCPFLSTSAENVRTPDGTLKCLIYEERPLPCRAYPVHAVYTWETTGARTAALDRNCDWLKDGKLEGSRRASKPFPLDLVKGLDYGSFARLQSSTAGRYDKTTTALWRCATGVFGKEGRPAHTIEGWIKVDWD